ncbi:MAG: penicillin-binding protein 2 [bacterium]
MEGFRGRLLGFALLVLLFFGVAFYRLVDLQLVHGEKYLRFSQLNTLREIPMPAPRGKILDREGRVLAENRPSFTLRLNPAQVKDAERAIRTLAYLLEWDSEAVREKLGAKRPNSLLSPALIAKDLDRDQVARIRLRMSRINTGMMPELDLSGIELVVHFERVYPYHEKVGHVLGYVREVNDKELKEWEQREPGRVSPGDDVGVAGVEKAFDLELRGYDGYRQTMVDALGREVDFSELGMNGLLQEKPAQGGETLQLTLDARLMEVAAEAFGKSAGSLVALDPRDGSILAWVSQPAYNPEDLTGTISKATWKELQENPDNILLNRPSQAAYPPGSTYKIVTAIAALAEKETNFQETINCPGYYTFGGRQWGCWNHRGHGRVNLHTALVSSCDVYFYKMGERLGPDRLAHYAKLLGLGQKTGVLNDSEREGLIPTRDWKEKARKEKWAPSDSLGIAIGQGFDLVTPLQNARMIAQFANGGKRITPHLLQATVDDSGERRPAPVDPPEPLPWNLGAKDYAAVKQALVDVVAGAGGTGAKARLAGIRVGGKTGTAQVVGNETRGKVAKGVKTEDHAWFVAFAPAEDPQIAIAVMVEHGGHGGAVAAPIAQRVMEEYFRNQGMLGKAEPPKPKQK